MSDSKFIKAYCSISKQNFGMKVDKVGGAFKVVDFYDISEDKAGKLSSNIDVPNIQTNGNLLPCFVCHSRKIAECACAKDKYACHAGMGYRYQCVYCSSLKVFGQDEGMVFSDEQKNEKVVLAQGQVVEICRTGSLALKQILIGVNWDPSIGGDNMDVDSSVIVLSPDNTQGELVYFGDLRHPSGCVVHRGDNLEGGKSTGNQSDDSENIDIFLPKVPESRDKLIFVVNIYKCNERKQNLGSVRNLSIQLSNAVNHKVLAEYHVTSNLKDQTGLIIGAAFRNHSSWFFKALGKGVYVQNLDDFYELCRKEITQL